MTKKSTSEEKGTSKKATIITWIKINLNIFENEKIKALEHMTHGDTYIVIWFKLLCMAGTVNDKGMIYLIEGKPYTIENLAHSMNRPIKLVKKAMELFEDLKMIQVIEGIIVPINWAKYQSIDRLNELSEYNRIKQQESTERNRKNVNLLSIENQRLSIIEVEVDIKNMKEKKY